MTTTALLAGSTGMLGNRIPGHLLDQPDVALRLFAARRGRGRSHQSRGGGRAHGQGRPGRHRTPGLVDLNEATVTLWGTGDEPFNLTSVDDTARFTARLATDPADVSGVRYLSGAETTFNAIAEETERLTGTPLTRNVQGSAADLRRIVEGADDPWSVIMQWYLLSMLTVAPFPTTDNDRYPDTRPTGLRDYLTGAHRARQAA